MLRRCNEAHDVDFVRSTLPNVGGITELMKVLAICETHAVGIIPHFTGPIATAALVNCLSTFSGPVMMEYNYGGRPIDYLAWPRGVYNASLIGMAKEAGYVALFTVDGGVNRYGDSTLRLRRTMIHGGCDERAFEDILGSGMYRACE